MFGELPLVGRAAEHEDFGGAGLAHGCFKVLTGGIVLFRKRDRPRHGYYARFLLQGGFDCLGVREEESVNLSRCHRQGQTCFMEKVNGLHSILTRAADSRSNLFSQSAERCVFKRTVASESASMDGDGYGDL